MLRFLKKTLNTAFTENGAVTCRTTGSDCLDLFATVGALRSRDENEIHRRFLRAYTEDPEIALRILFYARDVRGGLGEREVFRAVLRWLAENEKASLVRNLPYVAEFGRWDDVLTLLDTPARKETEQLLRRQFERDMAALERDEDVSLLGKWLPSVNASDADTVRRAKMLAKAFGLREAEYRKALSALRSRIRIIENHLRMRDYTFDYAKQPSKAMFKYRRAFLRCDEARYRAYMERVKAGKAGLHTGTLMPYELVASAYNVRPGERAILDATWKSLEDFTDGENAIVVADGSGSMYFGGSPLPATVAQSLAIYFAERSHGAFRNHFITFSMTPRLVEVKGADFVEKVRYCRTFNECANTNLMAVFRLILQAAAENGVPQRDLPSTLYIVSDMEFDRCVGDSSMTNFECARELYRSHGYKLPRVVFWNVQSRSEQQPVKMNEQGVALVSGCTPRVFSQIMKGRVDPYANMVQTVCAERYQVIRPA